MKCIMYKIVRSQLFMFFIIVRFLETRFATYNVGLLQNVANLSLLEAKFPLLTLL